MKRLVTILTLVIFAAETVPAGWCVEAPVPPPTAPAVPPAPVATTVQPATGTVGDELTVTGDNFDNSVRIGITDPVDDTKIIEVQPSQRVDAKTVKFKIPPALKGDNITVKFTLSNFGSPASNVLKFNFICKKDNREVVGFKSFDNYSSPLLMKLNLGYEYATVDNTFKKGFPRIGLTLYLRHYQSQNTCNTFGFFGIHNALTTQLTSSAEQATPTSGVTQGGTGGVSNMGNKMALEMDDMLFVPLIRTQYGVQLIGPIGVLGGKKVDSEAKIDGRYYGGIRLARNPEMYADIMIGRTESLSSTRLEARGQFPVYRDWLFVGAIGNFGIADKNKDRSQLTEADSVRVYITWNVEADTIFGKIFGLLPDAKK